MAVTRLNDSQKAELVARFRAGEGTQSLASAYGCSAATITRAVRAALDPEEYERLKQSGGRRGAASSLRGGGSSEAEAPALPPPEPAFPEPPGAAQMEAFAPEPEVALPEREEDLADDDAPSILAIDDADDFGADDEDDVEDDLEDDEEDELEDDDLEDDELEDDELEDDDDDDYGDGEEDDDEAQDDDAAVGIAAGRPRGSRHQAVAALAALGLAPAAGQPVETRPLEGATLPASLYMLVDKTVELQARPLSDFPELGPLEADDEDRQVLVAYGNPRQAKRQCGRSQRVIKIPDPAVFERTSRFLVAQGISRVLIEGSLYSLPGS